MSIPMARFLSFWTATATTTPREWERLKSNGNSLKIGFPLCVLSMFERISERVCSWERLRTALTRHILDDTFSRQRLEGTDWDVEGSCVLCGGCLAL